MPSGDALRSHGGRDSRGMFARAERSAQNGWNGVQIALRNAIEHVLLQHNRECEHQEAEARRSRPGYCAPASSRSGCGFVTKAVLCKAMAAGAPLALRPPQAPPSRAAVSAAFDAWAGGADKVSTSQIVEIVCTAARRAQQDQRQARRQRLEAKLTARSDITAITTVEAGEV